MAGGRVLWLGYLLLHSTAVMAQDWRSSMHYQRANIWTDEDGAALGDETRRKNVMLLIADDMRAEASPFMDEERRPWLNRAIHTPHLAALATRSLVLKQAFVQETRCNPSRSSFLTGRRPDSTHVHNNFQFFRSSGGSDVITLPQYFRQNGYKTLGFGKIFHAVLSVSPHVSYDTDKSWSKPIFDVREPYDVIDPVSWMAISPEARRE